MSFLRRYGPCSINLGRVNWIKIERNIIHFYFSQSVGTSGSWVYFSSDEPTAIRISFNSEKEAQEELNKIEHIMNGFIDTER